MCHAVLHVPDATLHVTSHVSHVASDSTRRRACRQGPYDRFFRFSFGPLSPESFESDMQLFTEVLNDYKKDVL